MASEDWKILRTISPVADDTDDWNDPVIAAALPDTIIASIPRKRPDVDLPVEGVQIAIWLYNGGARFDPATFSCTIQFFEIVDGLTEGRGVIHSDEVANVDGNAKVVTRDLPGATKFSVRLSATANVGIADELRIMWREV